MAILNQRKLCQQGAAAAASCRRENRKLVLLYCGVTALLMLGSNGLQLWLENGIGSTGGLSGLGTRSVLQTIQELLSYFNFFFTPFWSAGFLYAMIAMVRGRAPVAGDLTAGFRRFGRVLAHMAFELLVTVVVMVTVVNVASVIFTLTPMSADFAEKMEPLLSDPSILTADGSMDLSQIPMDAVMSAYLPMFVLMLVLFMAAYFYLSYCFRMSLYLVLDRSIGAVQAHIESLRLMRGHKWQMLRLDLHFWWYYLLGMLISLVGYLDIILTMLGIPLPIDATGMFFVTLGAYCVLNMALSLWQKCRVEGTYVLAFDAIAYPEPVQTGEIMEQ